MQTRHRAPLPYLAGLLLAASACGDDTSTGSGGSGAATSTGATASTAASPTGTPSSSSTASGDGGASGTGSGNSGGGATAPDAASSGSGTGGGGAGGPVASGCAATELAPPSTDCAAPNVRCVGGAGSEHDTIQQAADAAQPGDVVIVAAGAYAGFQIDTSGTDAAPIVFYASGEVLIDSPAGTGDGIRLENVSHVRVWGFSIEDVPERCIAARGATPEEPMVDDWIIGNRCRRSGVEGFYVSELSQSHVELNDIAETGQSGSTRSHGIYLANAGSDGTTICGNVITGAQPEESNGIHFNGDLSVGGDGVISGLVVESNVVYGNAQNGFNLDGVQASTFRNNVVYGNARHAMRAYAIDGAEGPADMVVVNNTFVAGDGSWPLRFTEDLGGHTVFDNILIGTDPEYGSIAIEDGVEIASDYNVLVDGFSPDGEDSVISLDAWQALGHDEHSIVSSLGELFADAAGGDFTLLSGAPAIDAGVATFDGVDAPTTDLEGGPRPLGAAYDCGAYEAE